MERPRSGHPSILEEPEMGFAQRLLQCDRAQDLAEYAMALGIIALAVVFIASALGTDVNSLWSRAQTTMDSVIDGLP
jgi:Flp pilus assembly pilin Flp